MSSLEDGFGGGVDDIVVNVNYGIYFWKVGPGSPWHSVTVGRVLFCSLTVQICQMAQNVLR